MTEFAIVCKNVATQWRQSGSLHPGLKIDTADEVARWSAVCSCCPADVPDEIDDPASLLEWCDSIRVIPEAELEAIEGMLGPTGLGADGGGGGMRGGGGSGGGGGGGGGEANFGAGGRRADGGAGSGGFGEGSYGDGQFLGAQGRSGGGGQWTGPAPGQGPGPGPGPGWSGGGSEHEVCVRWPGPPVSGPGSGAPSGAPARPGGS